MALVEFQNNTSPYLSADNLNNNFNYLDEKNNYSTNEIVIGKWIDNKPIYRKVINTGALPNNTTSYILHNINNLKRVVNIKGYAFRSSDSFNISLPYVSSFSKENDIQVAVLGGDIRIVTGSDRSAFVESYVVLEYTKTTD